MSFFTYIKAAAVLFAVSTNLHATLVQETWSSTTTSVTNTSAVSVGEVFQWSVMYDNDGTRTNSYINGPNRQSDSGGGDDILTGVQCMNADTDQGTCTEFADTSTAVLSDAAFNLAQLWTAIVPDPFIRKHDMWWNRSYMSISSDGDRTFAMYGNDLAFTMSRAVVKGADDVAIMVEFTHELTSTHPVPTPPVLALLGWGLLGMSRKLMRKA